MGAEALELFPGVLNTESRPARELDVELCGLLGPQNFNQRSQT